MPKIVKSIKGEMVDFDLLLLKQQISSTPSPIEVSERKEYIDNKLQSRIKRAKSELLKAKEISKARIEAEANKNLEVETLEEKLEESKPKITRKIKK